MKKVVHIISHSHWDREWYMSFEQHRMRLMDLMDGAMELFEKDENFKSFHLDGQTIMLDDYLEIKPENREKLEKYVREGRFFVGPWYILQDEFLTSGESCVRNILVGLQEAAKYGEVCPVGYFPDAFGNAGQMPQVLKQAGMKAVVFGRGVKPVGFNNQTLEGGAYESTYSEMNWESPDGSSLLGILFANWYSNGIEIPVDPVEAKKYWDERLEKAERFAGTRHLLFMNGCDHQPVQKDLSAAIETARKLYPDIEFVHSNFKDYVEAVQAEVGEDISCVRGELTSQETDGRWTLVNTTSSWTNLKQKNRQCETALEKKAEPLAAIAALAGRKCPKELIRYSWKKLMENHPHDSICSCSVDEVNEEVQTRFEKSLQVARGVAEDSRKYLAGRIDTTFCAKDENCLPFVVFNTDGWDKTGVVSAVLDYDRDFNPYLTRAYRAMDTMELPILTLRDAKGRRVQAKVEDLGTSFGYLLPDDRFRRAYMARQIRVTFEAENIPALGYAAYYLTDSAADAECPAVSMISGENAMENQYLKVEIHEDGSYTLTEKASGRQYGPMGYFEDTGDIGNEYIYVQSKGSGAITTKGVKADVELVEDEAFRAVYRIVHHLEIPAEADETLETERRRCAGFYDRQVGRSEKTVPLTLTTLLTLEKHARGVKAETSFENEAKDHRIRVLLPTGLRAEKHVADCPFEVVERNNRHSAAWENPSGCEHQQNFAAMEDEKGGVLVANFGLYEYEVLPDCDNTIAVTLLRCTGEMGDWGCFPTPKAQLLGSHSARYGIFLFGEGGMVDSYREGYQFQSELEVCQTEVHDGNLPAENGFFSWSGEGLNFTAMKQKENGDDVIVRFVNNTVKPSELVFPKQSWFESVYRSNVIEAELEEMTFDENGSCRTTVKPFEIATIGIRVKK